MSKKLEYWNNSYQAGEWDYLFHPDELGRYLILLGYIVYVCRARRVLDLGCGAGRLLELLLPYQLDRYVGVDISAEAIKRCRLLTGQRSQTALYLMNFDDFSTTEEFEVVVFNESIYCSDHPLDILEKAYGWLAPGGALLISICREVFPGDHEQHWQTASPLFTTIQATTVTNRHGLTWDVRMLCKRRVDNAVNLQGDGE